MRVVVALSDDGTITINPTRTDGTGAQFRVYANGTIDYYDSKSKVSWSKKLT